MGAFKALPDPTNGPQLAVGAHHTCAITSDGAITGTGNLYCWGDDTFDQLGNHDNTFKVSLPAPVAMQVQTQTITSATWVGVAAGDRHTCATLKITNTNVPPTYQLYCWGDGTNGQLGTIDTMGTEPGFQRLPKIIPMLH